MQKSDVQHLANLARLALTDEELDRFSKEMTGILEYVAQLSAVATDPLARTESPALRNVFREDADPHEAGIYTDDLLACAPEAQDGFVKVKKILNTADAE